MSGPQRKAQRSCLGCRQVDAQDQLVRYVLSPTREVLVDYRKKLPGRGAYTCVNEACIVAAVKRSQFDRTFKGKVEGAEAPRLVAALKTQLRDRIHNLLGMGRKAGVTVTGSNLVLSSLDATGSLALVLVAEDASTGIADKVIRKARACEVPWVRMFDKDVLGTAVGKQERSAVAFKAGALAESIKLELARYTHMAGEI